MHIPSVTLCTLAILTGKDAAQAAIAQSPDSLPPEDGNGADTAAIATVIPEPIVSVAAPESLTIDRTSAITVDQPLQTHIPSKVDNRDMEVMPDRWLQSSDQLLVVAEQTALPDVGLPAPAEIETRESIEADLTAPLNLAAEPIASSIPVPKPMAPEPLITPEAIAPSKVEFSHSASALLLTQAPPPTAPPDSPVMPEEVQELQRQLEELENRGEFGDRDRGSPAITIAIPSGFGADQFTGFVNFGFQAETRNTDESDGTMGVGIGVGDARQAVGLQLSYTLASFGGSRDFGTGGFNAKVHHRFPNGLGIAAGWEGFITTGNVDFEDSAYGSITQVVRTREDLDDPFSRIAFTAGVGSGRFRTAEAIQEDADTLGVFGSVAIRIARPVSAIVEWTGQDLAVGLSIAPVRNLPWVITPALRDIAGAGDGARFVIGTGFSFQF